MLTLHRVPRAGSRWSAALVAAESTAALTLAHTAAGGTLPGVDWLALIGVTAYAASRVVLRGRAPVRVMLPVLVAGQVLLHAWLVALTPSHLDAGHAGHAAAGGEGAAGLLGLTSPMLAAHVAAGCVAAAAWVLRRRAVDVLLGWSEQPAVAVPHPVRALTRPAAPRVRRAVLAVAPTRGPPGGSLATA